MGKEKHLRTSREFAAVRRTGRGISDRLLVLISMPNGLRVTRFGFSIGKRVGNAVTRNRIKRRLREALQINEIEEGWDLVVIARKDSSSAHFRDIMDSISKLLNRASILKVDSQSQKHDRDMNNV